MVLGSATTRESYIYSHWISSSSHQPSFIY